MGTTLNKLEYLDETKSQIKTALNQFGSQITEETKFRDYVDKINDIYDNWEKVTDEGTNITLNGVKKAKLTLGIKGNSTQEGTPTPTTPIPIKSVTGNNNVVVSNKNLLLNGTKFTPTVLGWADNNGNFINSYEQLIASNNYVDLKGGQAYTFKVDNYANIKGVQLVYLSGTTIQTFVNTNVDTNAHTFTPQTNTRVWARYNINAINTETYINAQLEPGSTATSYEEHKEQTLPLNLGDIELNKIGTYQDYIYKSGDKWYKHEEIKTINLGNITSVSTATIFGVSCKFVAYSLNEYITTTQQLNYNFLCNKVSQANGVANKYSGYINGRAFVVIIEDNDTVTTVNEKLNGATLKLIPTTATDIQITDTNLISQLEEIIKANSYDPTTIITSTYTEGNAQMIINASALKKGSE